MNIASSIIQSQLLQADGTSNVRETHTDNLGATYTFDYTWDGVFDLNAKLAAHAAAIPPQQADAELQNLLAFTLAGNDPRAFPFSWTDPATAFPWLLVTMATQIPSSQAILFAPIAITYDVDTLQADVPGLTSQQASDIVAWATALNAVYTSTAQAEAQRLSLATTL